MRKKFLGIMLCASLAMGLLSGCSSPQQSETEAAETTAAEAEAESETSEAEEMTTDADSEHVNAGTSDADGTMTVGADSAEAMGIMQIHRIFRDMLPELISMRDLLSTAYSVT